MENKLTASFRDPGGYIYEEDGKLYRRINQSCLEDYSLLLNSGFYNKLVSKGKIVEHKEISSADNHLVIAPKVIPFISYPYEWSFSQYKDAALLTLDLALKALEHGMLLKDASAYNIQFYEGHPLLIDTLSFTKYNEGTPWIAYGQFCRHFLAPLALMAFCDSRFAQLMRVYIDGIPLDLASKMLPERTKFNMGLQLHIHQHAKQQQHHADDRDNKSKQIKISRTSLIAILNNLGSLIKTFKNNRGKTEWTDYYKDMLNYSEDSFLNKGNIVREFLLQTGARFICDLGANKGAFSAIAAENADLVIAYDIDHDAVDAHYNWLKNSGVINVFPAVLDFTNPSPAIGWALQERMSTFERCKFDCVMALAVIHHICISNNIPLDMAAQMLASMGQWLIIEFVPKSDSQVGKLLSTREDIFPDYNENGFENAFNQKFEIISKKEITGSQRIMYLMKRY